MKLARIVLTDDEHGNATCPHDTIGDRPLPPPGHVPDGWPVLRCVRCEAWIIDLYEKDVARAVDALAEQFPGSSVSGWSC